MKKIVLMLVFVLLSPCLVKAQDTPAMEAYKKAQAEQAAKRGRERQEGLKLKEQAKRLEEETTAQAVEQEIEEAARQKECGDDYDQIRIGMQLSRIQQCVGEFFLRGQVETKYGIVDHYTRGATFLYVKDGNVVAWGY